MLKFKNNINVNILFLNLFFHLLDNNRFWTERFLRQLEQIIPEFRLSFKCITHFIWWEVSYQQNSSYELKVILTPSFVRITVSCGALPIITGWWLVILAFICDTYLIKPEFWLFLSCIPFLNHPMFFCHIIQMKNTDLYCEGLQIMIQVSNLAWSLLETFCLDSKL